MSDLIRNVLYLDMLDTYKYDINQSILYDCNVLVIE